MVAWPMRSIHNAGTGSTVYSLGGLGVYNGIMTNSPTWGAKGINFGGTSLVLIPTIVSPQYQMLMTSFSPIIDGATNSLQMFANNSTNLAVTEVADQGRLFRSARNIDAAIDDYRFTYNLSTGTQYLVSYYIDGTTKGVRYQRNMAASKRFTDDCRVASTQFVIGAGNAVGASSIRGYISFASLFSSRQSSVLYNIETLYIQTLGQNLGLV